MNAVVLSAKPTVSFFSYQQTSHRPGNVRYPLIWEWTDFVMKPRLVFVHGWGFNAGVWSQIAPHFDSYEITYWGSEYIRYGPPLAPGIPDGSFCVAYSFGVAQVLASNPSNLHGLVSICGFDALVARGRGVAIEAILSGLSRNACAQMRAFWASCGVNRFAPPEAIDGVELEQGLRTMLKLDAREQLRAASYPILALASRDDRVIPFYVSKTVWEKHALVTTDNGGHGLPMSRASWCVEQIKRFLELHVAQANN